MSQLTAFLEYALSSASVRASTKRRRRFGRLDGWSTSAYILELAMTITYHVTRKACACGKKMKLGGGCVGGEVRALKLYNYAFSTSVTTLAGTCREHQQPSFHCPVHHQLHILDFSLDIRQSTLGLGNYIDKSWETQIQRQDGGKPAPQCTRGAS